MPKRKRGEPSLQENVAKWQKELVRGLKLAKGFERQRLSKRIRQADPQKVARLEKEILVLKSIDLHQAAHAHLCSSLLKIKGVAESPKLPAEIKAVPKPELSEEEKAALHNVTSALCNRKQVKDVIEEAIMGTCIALRVPMPEKKGKGKGKGKDAEAKSTKAGKNEQAGDVGDLNDVADDESEDAEEPDFDGPPLLKRKAELVDGEEELESDPDSDSENSPFEGLSDTDAEENMFSKYDDLVGGSSDDEDDDEDEGDEENDDEDRVDSRARSIRKLALDDVSSSEASEDEDLAPAAKKAKVKAVKPVSFDTGNSAFLPTLMGGYISGSESASDVDVAPPVRKNRRGQRARQAIWEKKYGEKAKHHSKEKDTRSVGWDMKRGAVDIDGNTGSRPWKQGIKDPFEKNHVHPQRQQKMQSDNDRHSKGNDRRSRDSQDRGQSRQQDRSQNEQADKATPAPKPPPKRDDIGTLHPSWAAAKKAKEEVQKVEFKGKKVVFD
ncbi:Bud-site selection protein [Xylaria sp. CBS 124048]|nr:Bud-site selection protein [Xylaria sp. CBS 124048]